MSTETHGILTEMHPLTDEEILAEFDSLGGTASYHYADDSGKEWRAGDRLKEQALALVKAHPELRDEFLRIGERFLWSFGLWLETYEKRLGRRIDEAPLPPKAGQAGGESAEASSEGGQGLRPSAKNRRGSAMTFEDYLVLFPVPLSPLVEASMREGWNACMRQRDAEKENLEAAGEGLEQSFERAEEITRLKGVLVKCKEALKGMHEWFEAEENHAGTTFHERVEMCQAVQVNTVKALAALKEEGL